VSEFVFFYGTLMTAFNRPGRQRVNPDIEFVGPGLIRAALFDLGIYPAATPADDGSLVRGEVYQMRKPEAVLATLDEIEGYRPAEPERSLYTRHLIEVSLDYGRVEQAWVYFYNAPLGRAQRIASGDYLEHLKVRGEPATPSDDDE
jgi:gamma-glutamylcyclotransferase (GGCT)/AIG2-like uncharacterized protein YtfP